jgi:hypothetical protein
MLKNFTKAKSKNSMAGTRHSLTLLLFLLCSWQVFAQNGTVSGNMKDESGIEFPNGNYRLTATSTQSVLSIIVKL